MIDPPQDLFVRRKGRPFASSSSTGDTTWFESSLPNELTRPYEVHPNPGDVYVHTNTTTNCRQIWAYSRTGWETVDAFSQVRTFKHPEFPDRVLVFRSGGKGEPSYITEKSKITTAGRARARSAGE